jgi:hypothetical protein
VGKLILGQRGHGGLVCEDGRGAAVWVGGREGVGAFFFGDDVILGNFKR